MKKYTLIIIIIFLIIVSAFFVIRSNQNQARERGFYPVEDGVEKETEEYKDMIIENNKEDEDKITENGEPEKEEEKETEDKNKASANGFIRCLAEAGVVIYGSKTCPACASLTSSLGGYEAIKPIYVECSEEWDRCSSEMQTKYVPEIQIKGKLYTGSRSPDRIAEAVNCEI